jgi:heme exporter protein B
LKPASLFTSAIAVFQKDLRSEWRTRTAVSSLLLFAFAVLILVGYAVGPAQISKEDRPIVHSVLLWIVIFFSAMTGLARGFVHEEESGTAHALRLSTSSSAVFLGKLLANLALLFLVLLFVVPLFLALMSFGVASWPLFLLVLVTGAFGLAAASTFTAAIVSKASAKGAMFAVLAIPLLLPPLVAAVAGTRIAATETDLSAGIDILKLLIAYAGVVTTASFLLFDAVFRE